MQTVFTVALVAGGVLMLIPPAFVLGLNIFGMIAAQKKNGTTAGFKNTRHAPTCSVDADCPAGYVCSGGECVLCEL